MQIYPTTRFAARGTWLRAARALLPLGLLIMSAACAGYEKIPPASYPPIATASSGKFLIETADMTYRADRIEVTDSTLIIIEAEWMQSKESANYPRTPAPEIANPKVPIVLRLADVTEVNRVEVSSLRTVMLAAGIAAAAYAIFVLVYFSGSGGN